LVCKGTLSFFLKKKEKEATYSSFNIYFYTCIKPTTVLSFVERSESHLEEFGENIKVTWKPDATAIAIHVNNNNNNNNKDKTKATLYYKHIFIYIY
jgi:hypothetical protein